MKKILVLHGPCLHLLGRREPTVYGATTLADLNASLLRYGLEKGVTVVTEQGNGEEKLIDILTLAKQAWEIDAIIFNPAAYTHTSIALRDCLLAIEIPFIEVHISNIYARETFRHHSYFSDIAAGVISGLGVLGYQLALEAAIALLKVE